MGGKSGDPTQPVTDYYASVHYGVTLGADEITEVWYGEKKCWAGSLTASTTLDIDRKSLFGGNKVEGGLRARLEVLFGDSGQLLPQAVVNSLVRNGASSESSPARNPAYRGLLSIFVHGLPGDRAGANIGSNTAVIKPFWFGVRRKPKGCPFESTIMVDGMHLANPAGIIWECLTDADTFMGASPVMLDADSFAAAAATLNAEKFGLFLTWLEQERIENFVSAVLDHVEASLAIDPFTGKFRLKLIRDDYNVGDLPVFGPHNATLSNFDRKAWGETINEVNVAWTNPVNEQSETVTVHDTATISLQGGMIVSETRDYPGIRTSELALRVATRDLQAASSALASGELRVNRQAWRVLPGDVIALTWPEYGIDKIPMRVGNVDYGRPGDSMITLSVVEDVFGLPQQSYVDSEGSSWVDPAIEPVPLTHSVITSAPYYVLANTLGEADAEALADTSDYDIVFGTHPATGIFSYELMIQQTSSAGVLSWVDRGTYNPAGRGVLAEALTREVRSTVASFDDLAQGFNATPAALVWVGPNDDTAELALLETVDGTGYTVLRGVLDTVPKDWPVGTPVWFLPGTAAGSTGVERTIGETATARFLPSTSLGTLEIGDAPNVSDTMTGRAHRPYRPANLQANGLMRPDTAWYPEYPVTISWAGRNRLEETTLITGWSEAGVTPEPGVEYRVLVEAIDAQGDVFGTITDTVVPGESFDVTEASLGTTYAGATFIRVTVIAQRDGFDAWQSPSVEFRGPFRAPTGVFAVYRDPTAPTDLTATLVP